MTIPKPLSPPVELWGIKDALGNIVGIIDDAGKTIPMSDIASQGMAVITGERKYGHTLTAVPSRGYTFTAGQWTRNGTNIAGATGLTYLQTDADVDQKLFFIPTSPTYASPAGVSAPDVPGAPTIAITVGDSKLNFTITPSTYTGGAPVLESAVDVYNSTGFKVATANITGNGTTGVITKNIINGNTYTVKARQRNRAGWSDDSVGSNAASPVSDLPGQPAKPVLTAVVGGVSIAWSAGAAGLSPNTGNVWTDINGASTVLTTNPQVVSAPSDSPYTGTIRTQNANGFGPASLQADPVTPLPVPVNSVSLALGSGAIGAYAI